MDKGVKVFERENFQYVYEIFSMSKKCRAGNVEDVGRHLQDPVLSVLEEVVVVEVLDEVPRVESGFSGYRFEGTALWVPL